MLSFIKKNKGVILKVSVSAVLLTFLYFKIDRAAFIHSFSLFNFSYIPIVVLLIVLNYVVSSIRWKQLVNIYPNSEKASTWYLISLYFIGSFFNNFMPTSIGGDVYKILRLGKKIDSKSHAFSATFMERFTGMIALVFIAMFGFIMTFLRGYSGFETDFVTIGLITVGSLLVFAVGGFVGLKVLKIVSKKIEKVKKIYDSLMQYKGQNMVLTVAFISSFFVQLFSIFSQYYILVALGAHPDVFRSLFIFPVIILAGFFIPSLNGIGVQDSLYKFSNIFLMVSEPVAVAGSIVFHLFKLSISLVGGVLYALNRD